MADTIVRSRIDPAIKSEASKILKSMGLTLSDGIRLFLHQVVSKKELPFAIRSPNPVTQKAIELAEKGEVEPTTIEQISRDWDMACEK